MSIQTISSSIQQSEQYKIRRQTEAQQAEQSEQILQEQQAQQVQQVDEYDKANPVGEEVEGIYSVSHDENGNLKVDYKQPAEKSDDKKDAKSTEQPQKAQGTTTTSTDSTEDDEDDELEKLKEQRDTLKAQLNREADEGTKAQLRAQLQAVEAQIAMKSASVEV